MSIVFAFLVIILVFGSTVLLMIRHGYLSSPTAIQREQSKKNEQRKNNLYHLTKVAEQILAGDFNARAEVDDNDETSTLATALNTTTDQLRDLLKSLEERVVERARELEHLKTLQTVDQVIASGLDLQSTLNDLMPHIISQLNVDAADILLLHSDSNLLEVVSKRGFHTHLLGNFTLSESLAGRAVKEKHPVNVSKSETTLINPQFERLWVEEGFSSYWGIPLIVKEKVIGVLEIYHRTVFTPTTGWIEILETLANQIAITIDNARLLESLHRTNVDLAAAYDATIEGWSRALDLRDKETEGYTSRVTELAVRMAREMGMNDDELIHIRRGSLLHGIGKMAIPEAARIFAVADVYDTLSSELPYRKALSHEKILEYIREQAGKMLDPDVVEILVRVTKGNE